MALIENILFETCQPFFPEMEMSDVQEFVQLGERKTIEPKELIANTTFIFDEIWLVESGLIRAYLQEKKKEYTFDFFTQGFFIMDVESYYQKIPCYFLYEALAPTVYYVWKIETVLAFYKKYPQYTSGIQIFIEQAFLKHINRIIDLQTGTLKDRYLALLKLHGNVIRNVKQYYLASYLGVKPQSLSRIKNTLLHDEG